MRLSGARVLVTGASRGIGAEIARQVAARGAHVIVTGRDAVALEHVAAGIGAAAVSGDLTHPEDRREIVAFAATVDVLISCAGRGLAAPLAETPQSLIDELVAVNLHAPMQLTRAVLPGMLERGHGQLTYVASIAGLTGVAGEAVYAATKAGLLTFADSLRLELRGSGVSVSTVSPGAVDTEFWDGRGAAYTRRFPRPVTAAYVARLVVRDLERGRARRVTPRWLAIAPAVRAVAPGMYDRLAARFG